MIVKVLIKRVFKEGTIEEVKAIMRKIRSEALNRPGYVSGETLIDPSDRRKMLVISTWQNVQKWNRE